MNHLIRKAERCSSEASKKDAEKEGFAGDVSICCGNSHLQFMKAFSYHLPYGLKQAYKEEVEHLGLERLAGLIKICGFLMQTKVYLFFGEKKG